MQQFPFFPDAIKKRTNLGRETFSHGGIHSEQARITLEGRYKHLEAETKFLGRMALLSISTPSRA